MILNFEGMQTLMRLLHHNEMRVIYMMALGQEMPASVTKVHLTKIISVLCKIMNWIDNVDHRNSNPKYEKEVDIDIDEDVNLVQDDFDEFRIGNSEDDAITTEQNDGYDAKSGTDPETYNLINSQPIKKQHFEDKTMTTDQNDLERNQTGDAKPFSGGYCEEKIEQKQRLVVHKRNHTGEKPFSCSYCDYKASAPNHLKLHERIHNGDKPFSRLHHQKYPCSHCGKMFTQSGARQIHERIHTGVKPFQCSVCDYRCASSSNLRKHNKKHRD